MIYDRDVTIPVTDNNLLQLELHPSIITRPTSVKTQTVKHDKFMNY